MSPSEMSKREECDPLSADLPIYRVINDNGYAILDETLGQYVWYTQIPHDVCANEGEAIPEGWCVAPFNQLAREQLLRPLPSELVGKNHL